MFEGLVKYKMKDPMPLASEFSIEFLHLGNFVCSLFSSLLRENVNPKSENGFVHVTMKMPLSWVNKQ